MLLWDQTPMWVQISFQKLMKLVLLSFKVQLFLSFHTKGSSKIEHLKLIVQTLWHLNFFNFFSCHTLFKLICFSYINIYLNIGISLIYLKFVWNDFRKCLKTTCTFLFEKLAKDIYYKCLAIYIYELKLFFIFKTHQKIQIYL